ncbi:MAG: DMT family transporter [Rhodocyclaceae bacterium]|jgi:drug/metabolite transporter (DMT)-like permease|nr:DMT family transporter [Rhodocyclaceae bacterium]MCL4759410.1 DMT family transporter [Rhodocyclaceae bacterium]
MSLPLAYLSVVAIWATTPLAIKWSALGTGYAFAVMARMMIGVVLALALIAIWRVGLPLHARARRSYVVAGIGLFGGMYCTYWGARYIDSGMVSVLFGLAPLITSLFARMWLGEAALRPARLAGMLLGLAGLIVIFVGRGSGAADAAALAGMGALLVAVTIYSITLVLVKRIGDDSPPLATTAGSLIVATPLFTLAWWLTGGEIPVDAPPRALAAVVYLGVFGSVIGFALYYYVIKHSEAARVALITLVTPVLALLLGSVVDGEIVSVRVWLGTALICLGLSLHQWEMVADGRLRRRR